MQSSEVWHVMREDTEVASFEVNYVTDSILNYQILDNSHPVSLPFPDDCNGCPTFVDFMTYVYEHITPESRVNIDEILAEYGLTVYDPIEFIHHTHGVMAEDHDWVRFNDEQLTFAEVDIFERTK